MYKDDIKEINRYCQQGPDQLMDMIMMVSLSIRQHWSVVGTAMEDYRENGIDSRFLWGHKKRALLYLMEHIDYIYTDAMRVSRRERQDFELMNIFLEIPGIGLAKAGFIVQMFNGSVGCIDTHNARRLNIPASVLRYDSGCKWQVKEAKIIGYLRACKARRSEWLWNTWVNLIAKKYPKHFNGPDHVSRVHLEYLQS